MCLLLMVSACSRLRPPILCGAASLHPAQAKQVIAPRSRPILGRGWLLVMSLFKQLNCVRANIRKISGQAIVQAVAAMLMPARPGGSVLKKPLYNLAETFTV